MAVPRRAKRREEAVGWLMLYHKLLGAAAGAPRASRATFAGGLSVAMGSARIRTAASALVTFFFFAVCLSVSGRHLCGSRHACYAINLCILAPQATNKIHRVLPPRHLHLS
jgi:hypothetical protein